MRISNQIPLSFWLAGLLLISIFLIWQTLNYQSVRSIPTPKHTEPQTSQWEFQLERDGRNHGLSDSQCDAAFPDMYAEIERAAAWHRRDKPQGISEEHIALDQDQAQLRLLIYEGQLRIIDPRAFFPPIVPDRPAATVQAIARALLAVPDPRTIPNVEFTLDVGDRGHEGPSHAVWAYCRHRDDESVWVMPDFGFWSYPHPTVGSYDEFRSKVADSEEKKGFLKKKNKLVWRGNLGVNHDLRSALVEASVNRPWSDVQTLNWDAGADSNSIDMHEHCRYRFAAHTEGVTWSGRLRYLQNCGNVPVVHNLTWIAHYYPLLRADGPKQNFIEVASDFSDLDKKMTHYTARPREAENIAREAARVFRDRYLTPAAESCYWRKMFRSWSELQSFEPRIWTDPSRPGEEGQRRWRGTAWERWAATPKDWGQDAHP